MNGEPKQHEGINGCGAVARKPGILIADDMALILTLLKFELESRGFAVWLAVDGDDALDLYRRHRDEIDLVLLDVHMPGLDGPHTLDALQQLNPDVVACFMSGNSGMYTEEELRGRGPAWIFRKPFRPDEVADVLLRVASDAESPQFTSDWQAPFERGPGRAGLDRHEVSGERPHTPL
jgi:CheY-like chemotaxis protein